MSFTNQILEWYEKHRRDLPWRSTRDPYSIWISEVILQQTRVDQGLSYYHKFIASYPDIGSLALAREEEVLKLWQGLGYYSRARNMLYAARQVMNDYNGSFPDNYKELQQLKGVGSYTAAAIASIAFGEAVGVVDGNVKRVLARIFGLKHSGKQLHDVSFKTMMKYMDPKSPGAFNQAVMEFGAIHCTPSQPSCKSCIFANKCFAKQNELQNVLPLKSKRTKVKKRYFSYLFITSPDDGDLIIRKRSGNDIWKGLYEFPLVETDHEVNEDELLAHPQLGRLPVKKRIFANRSEQYHHQLSHQTIITRFYNIKTNINLINLLPGDKVVSKDKLTKYPVPRLIERYLLDK